MRLEALLFLSLLAVVACPAGETTVAPTRRIPATIAAVTTVSQTAVVGTAVATVPAVVVRDAKGQPVEGASVAWSVVGSGGSIQTGTALTNGSGVASVGQWTIGTKAGTNTLRASIETLTPVSFGATGTPGPATSLTINWGDGQIEVAGSMLPIAPSVRVGDQYGNGIQGFAVNFAVASGGGSLAGGNTATTDGNGIALSAPWTLGTPLGIQTLRATAPGTSIPALDIAAKAVPQSSFHITLRFLTSTTDRQRLAFERAVARWRKVVIGDLPDVVMNTPANSCGVGEPALAETVDDVLIFVQIGNIDGPGGILGGAGPCTYRSTGHLTITGVMQFDAADLQELEITNQLDDVILHEMGHVFGLGTYWPTFGLISGAGSADPYYTGAAGRSAWSSVGGSLYSGQHVPVENVGGSGTRDSHWRNSVLGAELMTGFAEPGTKLPLSLVTVRAMEDMGYAVTLYGDDAYWYPATAALRVSPERGGRELREMRLPRAPIPIAP